VRAAALLLLAATSCRTPDAPRERVVAAPAPACPDAAPPPVVMTRDAAAAEPDDPCNRRETLEHFRAHEFMVGWLPQADEDAFRKLWVTTESKRLPSPEITKQWVAEDVAKIVEALRQEKYAELAAHVAARGLCLMAAKGAECRWFRREEVARCGAGGRRDEWPVDNGQSHGPHLTCGEAMRNVFRVDFARATRSYNCFPPPGRGNNSASVINPELRTDAYVELYQPEREGYNDWRALWLYLRFEGSAWVLEGLMSEYWGI
jgi:hypothetical protein